jgi:CheY-like chemotaxis protein
MPDGGALTIGAANHTVNGEGPVGVAPGEYVAISVSDSGTGMAPDTIAKVFDPFFTTKDVGKGTGLGLSMVHGFANQSGGGVAIDSSVGKGTTVTLYLPRVTVERKESPAVPKDEVLPGSSDETILVVEDDHDVRAYTVGVLRELGYRVIEAYDGASALRLLSKQDQKIHLLVTDVVMPEMSGNVLADTARLSQPNLKVLFNSGYTRDAIMQDGRLEPGVDLISKPFTFQSLAAKVRELLDRE